MWVSWILGVAFGASAPCTASIEEYRQQVELTSSTAASTVDTYRFAVPEGTCSVLELPRSLDGFRIVGGDLEVRDGRLKRNRSWSAGDMVVVARKTALGRGPHAGEVEKPPFPVRTMSVQLTAPTWLRLSVWSSPHGKVSVDVNRKRTYRALFKDGGRMVWSTEKDWWAVGDRLKRTIDAKLIRPYQLGELGEGAEDLSVADILARVAEAVEVVDNGRSWKEARSGVAVLQEGRGSAPERGLVLLSLLRAAGYEANPVIVRPVDAADIPLLVPADALFERFAIRVRRGSLPDVWLDPRSSYTRTEAVPRDLRGVTVLEPGDLPRRLHPHPSPDGLVRIEARASIAEDGQVEITAQVTAEDGATQAIRDVLGPLPKETRKQWLADLLRVVRPELDGLRFQVFGIDDPSLPFGMSLEFDAPGAFRPLHTGLAGDLPAVLAPQLARVLPSNLEIVETLSVQGSEGMKLAAVRPVDEPVTPKAVVHRALDVQKKRTLLTTTAFRPFRDAPRTVEVDRSLDEASSRGPELLFFPIVDKDAARAVQKEGGNSEARVMEALLWLQAGDEEEASKALRRAVRSGRFPVVVDALRRFAPVGERRPWEVLWNAARDDVSRLAIVEALERKNELREAWRRASLLQRSEDPEVQILAFVAVARVQGERPAANIDEAGHKAWREPVLLLKRAEKLALARSSAGHPAVDVALAEAFLAKDGCSEAGERIQRAAASDDGPRTRAVLEAWRTCAGEESADIDFAALVEEAGHDTSVLRTVASTLAARGRPEEGLRWSLSAAYLERTDPTRWSEVVEVALAAGDLPTAVFAARRASDLQPKALTTGVPLQILATLLGDDDNARLASKRSGYQVSIGALPVPLEEADTFLEDEHRLGFYTVRDEEVLADAARLRDRRTRELAAGDSLAAARDAAWLARSFKDAEGVVGAYAAHAGAVWSTHSLEPLRLHLRDPEVRKLRMESALLTGAGDPMADVPYLKADPEAELLKETRYRTSSLAKRSGWPSGLKNPKAVAPPGMRSSRLLSALKGVTGFTHPGAGFVLLVSAEPDLLPPPLQGVFRLGDVVAEDRRVTVYRLEGGRVPGFVAKQTRGDLTFWGAARTPQLARYAVEAGVAAQ